MAAAGEAIARGAADADAPHRRGSPPERALVGCAGWSLTRIAGERFPGEGSHLERYAQRMPAVEINSSFYRSHRARTYEKWAESTPESFRFSVKVPKAITHDLRLVAAESDLDALLLDATALGEKLGCLLVQLPPKLEFDPDIATRFFSAVRHRFHRGVALEPRNSTWFDDEAQRVLEAHSIARVAADPARVPAAAEAGGWEGLVYIRLHGSPRMYYSPYDDTYLDALADRIRTAEARGVPVWCIFDNTASGAAAINAFDLIERLVGVRHARRSTLILDGVYWRFTFQRPACCPGNPDPAVVKVPSIVLGSVSLPTKVVCTVQPQPGSV